jgi:malate dehydrogenase
MNKIAIVGAGRVGEAAAQFIAQQELAREVVLIDIREGAPQGVALDVLQTAPFLGFDTLVTGSNDPAGLAGAELVVITAGIPRKPGMSRSDVLETNVAIIDGIVDEVLRHAPEAMILMVTNPVDVLTWRVWRRTGWPRQRVLGQAGVFDASRMATFIAMETGFSSRDITTMVLGGHGDSMVPLARFCTVNGIPVSHFVSDERIRDIIQRTRDGGAEILALRKNSSAYDAPGASVATMVDAISHHRHRLLPCVAILQGEYDREGIAMGVPCVLGEKGLEQVVELPLNPEEQRWFDDSAEAVAADIRRLRQAEKS